MSPFDCPPVPCKVCGQLLSWQPSSEDMWMWADAQGRTVVGGLEGEEITGHPSPYKILADVGARMLAATTGPKRSRGPMPSQLEVNAYSLLNGDPHAFGNRHVHRHEPCPHGGRHTRDDLPWHCGQPMWLRPSGWHCRARCGVTPTPVAPIR